MVSFSVWMIAVIEDPFLAATRVDPPDSRSLAVEPLEQGRELALEERIDVVDFLEPRPCGRRPIGHQRQTVRGDPVEPAIGGHRGLEQRLEPTGRGAEVLAAVAPPGRRGG